MGTVCISCSDYEKTSSNGSDSAKNSSNNLKSSNCIINVQEDMYSQLVDMQMGSEKSTCLELIKQMQEHIAES